jgi:hypothetical protein
MVERMKYLTKAVLFNPLLLLLLAITAVAGLIIVPTHLDRADYPVQSSARQPDTFVEAEVTAPASSNPADPEQSPYSAQGRNVAAMSAAESSSVRTAWSASPMIQSEEANVEVTTADSGDAGTTRPISDVETSFRSELSAKSEGVGIAVGAAQGSELVIPVPPGEKVPALFLDENPRPVPQQKMLDRVAAEFNEAVSNPPPGVSVEEAWEQARLNADQKYLKLFGYAAYNTYHLQAAKEAVREKKGLQSVQPSGQ